MDEKLSTLSQITDRLTSKVKAMGENKRAFNKKVGEYIDEIKECAIILGKIRNQHAKLMQNNKEIESAKRQVKECTERMEAMQQELEQLKVSDEKNKSEISALQEESASTKQAKDEAEQKMQELEEKSAANLAKLQEYITNITTQLDEMDKLKPSVQDLDELGLGNFIGELKTSMNTFMQQLDADSPTNPGDSGSPTPATVVAPTAATPTNTENQEPSGAVAVVSQPQSTQEPRRSARQQGLPPPSGGAKKRTQKNKKNKKTKKSKKASKMKRRTFKKMFRHIKRGGYTYSKKRTSLTVAKHLLHK